MIEAMHIDARAAVTISKADAVSPAAAATVDETAAAAIVDESAEIFAFLSASTASTAC